MILEIFGHLVALDFGWFVNLVISNPFWIMAFAAIGHFIFDKKPIFAGTLIALYLHATLDAAAIFGWVFRKGFIFAPMMVFFGLVIFDNFFGKTKFVDKRGVYVIAVFYLAMIFINVFMV